MGLSSMEDSVLNNSSLEPLSSGLGGGGADRKLNHTRTRARLIKTISFTNIQAYI